MQARRLMMLAVLALGCSGTGVRDDTADSEVDDTGPTGPGGIAGQVLAPHADGEHVVGGATVSIVGGAATVTDAIGYFAFDEVPAGTVLLRVEGPRIADPDHPLVYSTQQLRIDVSSALVTPVFPRLSVGCERVFDLQAATDLDISSCGLGGAAQLEFDPGDLRTATGGTFDGLVRVELAVMDPSVAAQVAAFAAPDPYADADSADVYGAIDVRLADALTGEPLFVDDDQSVTVRFELGDLGGADVSDLDLLWYDEAADAWVERPAGSQVVVGETTYYAFEADHFSTTMVSGSAPLPACLDLDVQCPDCRALGPGFNLIVEYWGTTSHGVQTWLQTAEVGLGDLYLLEEVRVPQQRELIGRVRYSDGARSVLVGSFHMNASPAGPPCGTSTSGPVVMQPVGGGCITGTISEPYLQACPRCRIYAELWIDGDKKGDIGRLLPGGPVAFCADLPDDFYPVSGTETQDVVIQTSSGLSALVAVGVDGRGASCSVAQGACDDVGNVDLAGLHVWLDVDVSRDVSNDPAYEVCLAATVPPASFVDSFVWRAFRAEAGSGACPDVGDRCWELGTEGDERDVCVPMAPGVYDFSVTSTYRTLNDDSRVEDFTLPPTTGAFAAFDATPQPVMFDDSVSFNAGASDHAQGATVLTYAWDFDDDGTDDASGPAPAYAFPVSGDRPVRLRVQDDQGNTDEVTRDVTVLGPRLEVAFTGGEGTAETDIGDISCVNGAGTCEDSFPADTFVTLTATPAPGSSFDGYNILECNDIGIATECFVLLDEDEVRVVHVGFSP